MLLVNKDPDNAHTVTIDYAGFTPSPARRRSTTYLNGATGIIHEPDRHRDRQTLPPYSLTTLILHPCCPAPARRPPAARRRPR